MSSKGKAILFANFKLEVQQKIVCRFAPKGRDVYSLAVPFFIRSSEGAQSLLAAASKVRYLVSLLTERDLWECAVAINISLLWSENQFNWYTGKLNSRFLSRAKGKLFAQLLIIVRQQLGAIRIKHPEFCQTHFLHS